MLNLALCGVNAQSYEIAIRNDAKTAWIYGSGLNNYKNSSISGIGGDTIYMRIQDSFGAVADIDSCVIENDNTTPYSFCTIQNSDTILYVLPSDNISFIGNPIFIKAYIANGTTVRCTLFPKFLPPIVSIADGSKNTSKILTLADFNIYINPICTFNNAYSDSIYWYKNGELILNISDTSYTTTENGEYSVKVKIVYISKTSPTDSCVYVRWVSSDTVTVSSIDTYVNNYTTNNDKFNIYPNPAHYTITVEQPFPENTTISIFNITGQLVLQTKIKTPIQQIDISGIPNGSYFIQAKSNNKTEFGKIVKL